MRYPPVRELRTITLDKIQVAGRRGISRYAVAHAELREYEDLTADRLIMEISSHVLGKRVQHEKEIVEEPYYPSWRHQLVASLPEGFRRRFLTYFWGFENGALMKQRRHYVSIDARCVFPDAEIVVPKEMGTAYRFAAVESYAAWDDEEER